jgi:prepilin-type N-terminal cleavage/methylation domain-containing protein
MKKYESGFTIIEMLVTVAMLAALGGLTCVGIQSAREKAKTVVEINAARNLITGYLGHAAENNGQVLAGYLADPSATNLEGKTLGFPMNARYPWRLARSLPAVKGVLVFNGNESMLKLEDRDYRVSAGPNLGLNATLVGGHFGSSSLLAPTPRIVDAYGKFYLSHLAESGDPERLIVFSSARSGDRQPGYFEVRPPHLTGPVWSADKFTKESQASAHGFVDLRWGGKAVAVMLGGNVELLDDSQLRDMRRWSHRAALANERDFTIKRTQ